MRLIDADSLFVNIDKGIQGTARKYLKFYQMAVNDEPTAYDVDKVVEQLKTEAMYEDAPVYEEDKESDNYIRVSKAIEIVKAEMNG